jgi:prepilin-type processing-associated H-X9-DG protein
LTLGDFQNPATTVMLAELGVGSRNDLSDLQTPRLDGVELIAPSQDLDDEGDERPAARHFGRACVGFADGHVGALRMDQFYTHQSPPDRWFTP